jgi:hypothetical protein
MHMSKLRSSKDRPGWSLQHSHKALHAGSDYLKQTREGHSSLGLIGNVHKQFMTAIVHHLPVVDAGIDSRTLSADFSLCRNLGQHAVQGHNIVLCGFRPSRNGDCVAAFSLSCATSLEAADTPLTREK